MTTDPNDIDRAWWKEAVVYQIYPQSYQDTNGDGIGDLPGIEARLDYLDDLGVDVVWLNPVYDSPHADNGYDVRDYRHILDDYGTIADWERLLEGLHERDIGLIMDLVLNHTSDEHEWFEASRRGEGYEDFYHWVEGSPDEPPNNWTSFFGGPAWTWDEEREAWYLHLFHEKQPDLNWENPTVRAEVYDIVNYWLEKGIDGFRLDVINLLSKPEGYPDGEPSDDLVGAEHYIDGPRIEEFLAELKAETYGDYDVMTVGECAGITLEAARRYTTPEGPFDMTFHFEHTSIDHGPGGWWDLADWTLADLRTIMSRWQTGLDEGWNAPYFNNHDQPRAVSRFGDDEAYPFASGTLLATLLLTLRGTPFVYQGEEIGMTNYPFTSLDEIEDADAGNRVRLALEEGRFDSFEDVQHIVRYRCRDNARTPMQWDDSENAGFSDGEPWIVVNPNYTDINVAAARADEGSIWYHYQDLIALRHEHDALVYGEYELLTPDHPQVWAYTRTLGDERLLVVLNFEGSETAVPDAVPALEDAHLLRGNYPDADPDALEPYEARLYDLS